jgi:hypothetical protein
MSRVVRLETNGSSEPVVEICPRKPATIVATTDDGALVDWTVGDTQIVDPSPDNSIWGAPKLPDSPSNRMDVWKGEVIASTEEELLSGIQR